MNKPPIWTIHQGDALTVLRTLPSESVHCVVTSPPYWGLRDYGTATWTDGDSNCDHLEPQGGAGEASAKQNTSVGSQIMQYKHKCGKCDAVREDGQIGLEPTPDEYVAKMVDVFAEVRRVLRKDGVLFLNLGDSYSGSWGNYGGQNRGNGKQREITSGSKAPQKSYEGLELWKPLTANGLNGIKPKDLVGIPWMVAFALRADGWYLRSDIIWSKPNPMPESVTDRPTKSHEYLFLLTKSERYYFDQEAVRVPLARLWNPKTNGGSWAHTERQPEGTKAGHHSGAYPEPNSAGANIRSVWTIPTKPFPEAHFATFPPELVRTCLLAGVSERGVCSNCGNPMVRIVEKIKPPLRSVISETAPGQTAHGLLGVARFDEPIQVKTIGWEPSCKCDAPTISATVLDPFSGSGTTGVVATKMGYNYIGIELNPEYVAMSERRLVAVNQQHGVFV